MTTSQCTSSFQRSNNWILLSASKSTQRYRVRERKWQTRETLTKGVYPPFTPLHTNGKEKTELQETLKVCINLESGGFLPIWIQILLVRKTLIFSIKSGSMCKHQGSSE